MPTRTNKNTEPAIEAQYVDQPIEGPAETVTFKKSYFYAALIVLAFAAGILVGYIVWGAGVVSVASPAGGPVVTEAPHFVRYDIPSEGFHSIGPSDAPITIVEFSDYQCPYCRQWHQEVYQSLLAAYPQKIRLVYRNLPLTSVHPDAFDAAEAAMCAGEQDDAYWQYHDKLFSSESLGNQVYVQYAQDLGLDMTTFEACLTEHKYQSTIQSDMDFAVNLGIRSTPTFFINGLAVVGAQPLSVFQEVIDKELAGEIPN